MNNQNYVKQVEAARRRFYLSVANDIFNYLGIVYDNYEELVDKYLKTNAGKRITIKGFAEYLKKNKIDLDVIWEEMVDMEPLKRSITTEYLTYKTAIGAHLGAPVFITQHFLTEEALNGILSLSKNGIKKSANQIFNQVKVMPTKLIARRIRTLVREHNMSLGDIYHELRKPSEGGIASNLAKWDYEKAIMKEHTWLSVRQAQHLADSGIKAISTIVYDNMASYAESEYINYINGWRWITASDSRVEEECQVLNGKIGKGENRQSLIFSDGKHHAIPQHFGCRCVLVPVPKTL